MLFSSSFFSLFSEKRSFITFVCSIHFHQLKIMWLSVCFLLSFSPLLWGFWYTFFLTFSHGKKEKLFMRNYKFWGVRKYSVTCLKEDIISISNSYQFLWHDQCWWLWQVWQHTCVKNLIRFWHSFLSTVCHTCAKTSLTSVVMASLSCLRMN